MRIELLNFINNIILRDASKLSYIIKPNAPSNELDLFNHSSLIIWSGQSDNTIYQDKIVNYAFRALHDHLHLITGLGFCPKNEIELGRIQASKYEGILADLVYSEVSAQALYFQKTGQFIQNQVEFTNSYLKSLGYKIN